MHASTARESRSYDAALQRVDSPDCARPREDGSPELPPCKERRGSRDAEDDEKDRQLLGSGVAGSLYAQVHIEANRS